MAFNHITTIEQWIIEDERVHQQYDKQYLLTEEGRKIIHDLINQRRKIFDQAKHDVTLSFVVRGETYSFQTTYCTIKHRQYPLSFKDFSTYMGKKKDFKTIPQIDGPMFFERKTFREVTEMCVPPLPIDEKRK